MAKIQDSAALFVVYLPIVFLHKINRPTNKPPKKQRIKQSAKRYRKRMLLIPHTVILRPGHFSTKPFFNVDC